MATDNLNQAPQVVDFGNGQKRVDICLDATYQIDAMSTALLNCAQNPDIDSLPYLVQGMVARVKELNLVIMGALDDSGWSESDLIQRMTCADKNTITA